MDRSDKIRAALDGFRAQVDASRDGEAHRRSSTRSRRSTPTDPETRA
jgi:hypothetical protein